VCRAPERILESVDGGEFVIVDRLVMFVVRLLVIVVRFVEMAIISVIAISKESWNA
jgi:hypothetical protein